jgi:hypothetical protein
MLDAMTDPTAKHVTLVKAPATSTPPEPQGRATYVSEKGALIFLASNMEPLQPYKVYELWLFPPGSGRARSRREHSIRMSAEMRA